MLQQAKPESPQLQMKIKSLSSLDLPTQLTLSLLANHQVSSTLTILQNDFRNLTMKAIHGDIEMLCCLSQLQYNITLTGKVQVLVKKKKISRKDLYHQSIHINQYIGQHSKAETDLAVMRFVDSGETICARNL